MGWLVTEGLRSSGLICTEGAACGVKTGMVSTTDGVATGCVVAVAGAATAECSAGGLTGLGGGGRASLRLDFLAAFALRACSASRFLSASLSAWYSSHFDWSSCADRRLVLSKLIRA